MNERKNMKMNKGAYTVNSSFHSGYMFMKNATHVCDNTRHRGTVYAAAEWQEEAS